MNAFRALLAIVLLLNGLAIPLATAQHAAPGMASHAGHATDPAPAGDCCDAELCDCGCAAPQATTLPVSLARTSWRTALAEFSVVVMSLPTSPPPVPFRPPA